MAEQLWFAKLGLVVVAMLVAIMGPDAYLSRRQGKLYIGYRIDFPDCWI